MRECLGEYQGSNTVCARLCPKRGRCKVASGERGLPKLKGVGRGQQARWRLKEESHGRGSQQGCAGGSKRQAVPKGTRRTKPEATAVPKGTRRHRVSVPKSTRRPGTRIVGGK